MQQADVIVIGSGQGAVPLATSFAAEGQNVVLFERGRFGGTCVKSGCQPSKAFLASAHAAAAARASEELGIRAAVEIDSHRVMERARRIIDQSTGGVKDRLESAGVHLVNAEARFVDERTVRGGDSEVSAPLIIVNTGKSPAIPPIPGLDETPYLTYESFWQLDRVPRRVLVLGGGYVGIELGQGLARLGSDTHILEKSGRIVSTEEEDVSQIVAEALAHDGAHIRTNTKVTHVSTARDQITVELSDGDSLTGDALLVATGRRPNTGALNAEAAGVELDERGHIKVNERFQTTNPAVYAIGDVTGQPEFTHVSWEDYRRLRAILNGEDRRQRDRVLGYVFFTEPQVGRAGLTLDQALEQGYDAESATLGLESVSRARLTGAGAGFYRMVIDTETDKILGATLVGPACGELVHVFIAHMEAGSTWQVLEQSVHVHPTYAEGLPVLAREFK